MTLTPQERAYLAGLIDGEGCFNIASRDAGRANPTYTNMVIVSLCDKETLDYWCDRTGLGRVWKLTFKRETQKESYQWRVHAQQAVELIDLTREYLMVKKEAAKVMLRFRETFEGYRSKKLPVSIVEERERCKDLLHQINRQGPL